MPNPPVPIERKRALGNPGKRALPKVSETAVVVPISDAPEHLGEGGLAAWHQITRTAPWIGASDQGLLVSLCEKIERRDKMVEQMANDQFVIVTDKGYPVANPLVGMLSTIETDIVKMMSLLGLTPTDRTRLGIAEVKAQSTLEKLRALKDAK